MESLKIVKYDNKNLRKKFAISSKKYISIFAVFPLLTGGLIYILWRPMGLVMFDWFSRIGIGNVIEQSRLTVYPLIYYFPDWVIYSLPNGLWIFSLTMLLTFIWIESKNIILKYIFIFLGPLVGIVAEIGQLYGFIPGTFDWEDIIIVLVFSFMSYLIIFLMRKEVKI